MITVLLRVAAGPQGIAHLACVGMFKKADGGVSKSTQLKCTKSGVHSWNLTAHLYKTSGRLHDCSSTTAMDSIETAGNVPAKHSIRLVNSVIKTPPHYTRQEYQVKSRPEFGDLAQLHGDHSALTIQSTVAQQAFHLHRLCNGGLAHMVCPHTQNSQKILQALY